MSAVTYNVTVPAGTKACYIAGEMNSWSFTEMTKVDDTHYTLDLPSATEAMKYKYCSGPGWAYVEKDASGNEIGDRSYSAADVVAKWASVYEPSATPEEPKEEKDITVKAKVPAAWTKTITAWVWPTGGEGKEVTPTKEGDWYVYTEHCAELNIIFKNGAGWNGDANQTVDMVFSENTCIEITAGAGKANYTQVDCEGGDPVVTPSAYYVTGTFNGWTNPDENYVMTGEGNIYGLVSIAIPSSTILEDDVEFSAVVCINIPVTLFGRCNFFTFATSRPYPCSDGLSPSSWNFSFYSDILFFFWLFWCSAWFIYRSPFRYYICGRVTTVSYFIARSIFFNISPTWTRAVFVLHSFGSSW